MNLIVLVPEFMNYFTPNGYSDKRFHLTSKLSPPGVICSRSRAIFIFTSAIGLHKSTFLRCGYFSDCIISMKTKLRFS